VALSRREFQILQERVAKLEMQVRALDNRLKASESMMKPSNLARRVREGDEEIKRAAERGEMFDALRPESEP
jgi:hypothetical protein